MGSNTKTDLRFLDVRNSTKIVTAGLRLWTSRMIYEPSPVVQSCLTKENFEFFSVRDQVLQMTIIAENGAAVGMRKFTSP